jgi:ABC-2 type transport system permease protein
VTRALGAELLKLRTARTYWALAGATLGLVLLITVLTLALTDEFRTEDDARSVLSTAGASGLLLLVLGVVAGAGEYRHGTIASTLLFTPNRLRVMAAQALACAAAGLAIGLATAALTAAVALPWLSAKGAASLSAGELLGLFGGGCLYTALAGALGAGVGALLRNQVVAVVLVLVVLFIVDPTVSSLVEDYSKFSLNGLGLSMSGGSGDDLGGTDLLPFGVAALVWAGYTAVLVVAAAVLTARRDI